MTRKGVRSLTGARVLFDCLAPVADSNNRFNLDVKCGVTVSIGYSQASASSSVVADIMMETPYINSLGTGEILPLDNIESLTRKKLIDAADACGKLSDELLRHKQRLEDLATSDDDLLPADMVEDAIAHGAVALSSSATAAASLAVDVERRRIPHSSRSLDSAPTDGEEKPARRGRRSSVNVDFLNAAMAGIGKPEL